MSQKNMAKLANWERFFEERDIYDPTAFDKEQKIIRLPKDFFHIIRRNMRMLEDENIDTNFTEYAIVSLMVMSNATINKNGDFTTRSNGMNLSNYFNELKKKKK